MVIKEVIFVRFVETLYKDRASHSIKNDYGKTLIIGGSNYYLGAPLISSMFALLSGCGYVAVSVPQCIKSSVLARLNLNVVIEDLADDNSFVVNDNSIKIINKYDSILFGNGIAENKENELFLKTLINNCHNLVIDAGGINLIANNNNLLIREINNKILLTPHIGELNRLLNIKKKSRDSIDYILETKEFAQKYKVNILIKSYNSTLVLADGSIYKSNYSPTPSLARAGSGDALAGYLSGLLAYGLKYFSYQDIIIKGDLLIHTAALNFGLNYSNGLLDALSLAKELEDLIIESQTNYYLAYGSNLNINKMKERCKNSKVVGKSKLNGYKLVCNKYLDLVKEVNSYALIGVYEYQKDDEINLDIYEDYPNLYDKEDIPFILNNRYQIGLIYFMKLHLNVKPTDSYILECKKGYEDFEFEKEALNKAFLGE